MRSAGDPLSGMHAGGIASGSTAAPGAVYSLTSLSSHPIRGLPAFAAFAGLSSFLRLSFLFGPRMATGEAGGPGSNSARLGLLMSKGDT